MDVSDIFNFFLLVKGGRGSPRRQEGGASVFFTENPTRGGGVSRRGRGREGVSGELGNLGGGWGLNIFFGGPKRPPS